MFEVADSRRSLEVLASTARAEETDPERRCLTTLVCQKQLVINYYLPFCVSYRYRTTSVSHRMFHRSVHQPKRGLCL